MLTNFLAAQLYSALVNFMPGVAVTFHIGDFDDAPAVRDLRSAPRRIKLTSVSSRWTELQTSVRKQFYVVHEVDTR